MMPFSKKQKDEPADEERIERPKSPFDDEHNIALDGQPDHRDAIDPDDADYEEEEEEKESFLSRHRQPILLGASIIAIVAMTANLINQNTGQTNGQGAGDAPALTQPTDADMSALDETINPRQIDLTQRPEIEVGELAALTDQNALANQNVGLVAPMAVNTDQDLTTASVSPEPGTSTLDEMAQDIGPEGLRMAAAGGDVRAQFEMGAILMEGQAVPKDSRAAAKWFEQAAAAGYAPRNTVLLPRLSMGLACRKMWIRPGNGTSAPPKMATVWRCTIWQRYMPLPMEITRISTKQVFGLSVPLTKA